MNAADEAIKEIEAIIAENRLTDKQREALQIGIQAVSLMQGRYDIVDGRIYDRTYDMFIDEFEDAT